MRPITSSMRSRVRCRLLIQPDIEYLQIGFFPENLRLFTDHDPTYHAALHRQDMADMLGQHPRLISAAAALFQVDGQGFHLIERGGDASFAISQRHDFCQDAGEDLMLLRSSRPKTF